MTVTLHHRDRLDSNDFPDEENVPQRTSTTRIHGKQLTSARSAHCQKYKPNDVINAVSMMLVFVTLVLHELIDYSI